MLFPILCNSDGMPNPHETASMKGAYRITGSKQVEYKCCNEKYPIKPHE